MAYRYDNRHSFAFMLRKVGRSAAQPFVEFRRFLHVTNKDIRKSEERDFGFFVNRGIAPERSASVFA